MKNLTILALIFVSLVSKGQCTFTNNIPSPIINSNQTVCITENMTITYASVVNYGTITISDGVTVTFTGSIFNTGKIHLLGCNSQLNINGALTGSYNKADIERSCSTCSSLNNVTSIGISVGYLNVIGTVSYLDLACMTVLPVELLNMGIDCNNKTINWSTAAEINNDYFTVKYSSDAINWVSIGEVDGQGNSSKTVKYDYPITTNGYYRISQTDFDGNNEYFDTFYCGNISDDVTLISTYNLLGQVVSNGTRGLVIELYSDGTTKKLLR